MCPALMSGLSPAAGLYGSSGTGSISLPALKALCPELVFPILSHRLLRHALRTTFLHATACDRALCRRDRSSINPTFNQQGPDDTCHFVGERDRDEHTRLAREHALQP